VVEGLINLTEAQEQTARYNDLFRTMRQEEFLHPICTSHLCHLHASSRPEVLTNKAQDTLNPLDVEAVAPEGQDVRRIDAISLPRLPDKEQWEAVRPQLKMGPNLTEEQKSQLLEVLSRHPHAFSKDPRDCDWLRESTTGWIPEMARPSRGQAAPSAPSSAKKSIVRWHQLEKWNVIRPSTSPFAAPVVLARKKGGKWQLCVDYRALNKLTVPSRYPLPRIDGILNKLGPARFFATLNAQSGYWQIPMHPDDVHKTAFLTHRGLFEFLRMPFGLTTAPGTYQMGMDDLLKEELRGTTPTVTQYLDDTLLFTVTFEEHLVVLEAVFIKVESIDLKLCPSKCLFGADETKHLGHLIAHNLLLPAPEKVRAIRDWIETINVAEVRSFLGLAGYYRHFIRDFAKIAKPLHGQTREQATFEWGEHEKLSMELLKDALCQTQGITRPEFNKPFMLNTDYSRIGISATLSQVNDLHEERPIAFASRGADPQLLDESRSQPHGATSNIQPLRGKHLTCGPCP
jgi:hypothetical protein